MVRPSSWHQYAPPHPNGVQLTNMYPACRTFYPPTKTCTNPECASWQKGSLLKKEEQCEVIAFTLADGVQPAWSVHLKCRCKFFVLHHSLVDSLKPVCHTNYHNNYSVCAGVHTYYPGVPRFIQVGEHQFVQHELALQWADLMQVA